MTLDRFFDNFQYVANAPNGVQKLREMILQLAFRGRLVPQNPGDEAVEALLQKMKRTASDDPPNGRDAPETVQELEIPFRIPASWVWVRLATVGKIVGGGTPRSSNPRYFAQDGIPWLTPADLYGFKGKLIERGKRDLSEEGLENSSAQLMPKGTILFSSRAPIGYVAIAANDLSTNQGFKSCVPYESEMSEFIYYYLKSAGEEIDRNASGTTFREISGKGMKKTLFPLPPLAEQKRIVAKVDELMKRCDDLEARQKERNERRTMLTASSLHALVSTPRKSAGTAIRRVSDYFNLLIDTPETVAELRKTILQLAVQGRLVPQLPSDGTAEQALRFQRKKASGQKILSRVGALLIPTKGLFAIPANWAWVSFREVIQRTDYGTSQKTSEDDNGIPVFRMNNIRDGKLDYNGLKYIPEECSDLPRLYLEDGDILFNRTNSAELVGKSAVFRNTPRSFSFASYLIRVALAQTIALPEFFNMVINSPYFRRSQIEPTLTQQCGQANFSATKLAAASVPLPPFPEQKRIVLKFNELMALCAELETRLVKARDDADTLLAAFVYHLHNPKTENAREMAV